MLDGLSAGLVRRLTEAGPAAQRRAARAAASLALRHAPVPDDRVLDGFLAFDAGRFGGGERGPLDALIAELDEATWRHQDDTGEAGDELFGRARAVAALHAALHEDAAQAAYDAAYEAHACLEDGEAIEAAIEAALQGTAAGAR